MKKYISPAIEKVNLFTSDIISTSGFTVSDSGSGDSHKWSDYAKDIADPGNFN